MTEIPLTEKYNPPSVTAAHRRRVAYYGGSFDPVHRGHITIANAVCDQFDLDEFVFIPAFQAPHKVRLQPTSAYDRYAMLCLVTQNEPKISVSKIEIEMPERPFSVETLTRINAERPNDDIFFVMGADSWMDIKTWREWETVLTMCNHIVLTRPGYKIGISHVTGEIRSRIVDLRKNFNAKPQRRKNGMAQGQIFITDAVNIDISATGIRSRIRENDMKWLDDVPVEVANYVEKYQIYK